MKITYDNIQSYIIGEYFIKLGYITPYWLK